MDHDSLQQKQAGRTSSTLRGILLMILCTFFVAAGELFYKLASIQVNASHVFSFINWPLIIGLLFYGVGSVLLLSAFKYGQLSVLYPFLAVSYIWVSVGAPFVFRNETMTINQWIGMGSVVVGVCLVGMGGGREQEWA